MTNRRLCQIISSRFSSSRSSPQNIIKKMLEPPSCKKVPYTHQYHGEHALLEDSFHWLKDMDPKEKKPEIIEYIKAENAYTSAVHLEKNKDLTDTIYKEVLSRINEDDEDVPVFHAPYFYYKRTVKGSSYPLHCRRRESMENKEEVILDLNLRTEEYIDLRALKISPDHKLLAFSLDFEGSEKYRIFFIELESGNLLESETISECSGSLCWAADSKTVWYSVLDSVQRPHKVFRHTLGSKEGDVLVYHDPDPKFFVGMNLSLSKEYLFVQSSSSLTSECHFLKTANPTAPLQLFKGREVGHRYDIEHQGTRFLIRTDGSKKFLNYRLCSCPIDDTSKWEEVIPYNPYIEIEEVTPFKNFLVIAERTEATVKIKILKAQNGVLDGSGSIHYIDIEEALYSAYVSSYHELDYNSQVVRFVYSTPISDAKVIEYDMSTRSRKVLKAKKIPGSFNPAEYTLERVYSPIAKENQVAAPFDTPVADKIPISLFYKTSLFKGDGSNPCYLYGYGSYGISIDCGWSSSKISLLDRGFVFAIAHIRGGGDNGRAWYETGKFKNKKNTFLDFQSCAKTLIAKKFTSSSVLAIDGRSAGGMLIGATLNLDPSLYAVAVAGVPFVDVINTMMDDTIPLTINEYEEWGNPNERDFFDYMLSYSPYDNIPKGNKFPDMLIKAGLFDPRVQYWEPAKWLARLRDWKMDRTVEDDPSPSIFVFDCKMGSGHFGSTGRYAYIKEIAQDYAFVVDRILNKPSTIAPLYILP